MYFWTPIATSNSLNLLLAHSSRSVIEKVETTARSWERCSWDRLICDTNSVLYVEYTIARDLDAHASDLYAKCPRCTCTVVYGATHVPFTLRELQYIDEESCISWTRAFYRNLQIRNLEKLAWNNLVGFICSINLKRSEQTLNIHTHKMITVTLAHAPSVNQSDICMREQPFDVIHVGMCAHRLPTVPTCTCIMFSIVHLRICDIAMSHVQPPLPQPRAATWPDHVLVKISWL